MCQISEASAIGENEEEIKEEVPALRERKGHNENMM